MELNVSPPVSRGLRLETDTQAGLPANTCFYRRMRQVWRKPTGELPDPAREFRPSKPAQGLRGELEFARHNRWQEVAKTVSGQAAFAQATPLPKRPSAVSSGDYSQPSSHPRRDSSGMGTLCSVSHTGVVDYICHCTPGV